MAEIRTWWRDHRPTTRRLAQLYAALLYNAHLKGFVQGRIFTGASKALCVPGLNCYSCPGAVGACPLGALQNALSASGHTAPWYVLGILLLYGLLLGRTVCGWLCPVGLIQELLHKIPTPKLKKSRVTRALSHLKYAVLAVFAVILPLREGLRSGTALPAFCKYLCPAGTLEGAVGLLSNPRNSTSFYQLGLLFTDKLVIMLAVGLACVFCYRAFCRFLCPLGAIYSLFNKFAVAGVKVDPARCNGCGACARRCPMDVRCVGDRECISCGRCVGACAQGAIALRCGGFTLIGPEAGKNADPAPVIRRRKRLGRIAWGAALAALIALLARLNAPAADRAGVEAPPEVTAAEATTKPTSPSDAAATAVPAGSSANSAALADPAPSPDAALAGSSADSAALADPAASPDAAPVDSSAAPAGSGVGEALPDFSTELIGGGEFRLSEHRGQVVMINLWATYCPPCVEELPYFERLAVAHPDMEVLAIHHATGARRAEEYLSDKGWTHIDFAKDSREKGLFDIVDGSEAMPQTIVLDTRGEVVYNAQAPVSYEQLEALYGQASQYE